MIRVDFPSLCPTLTQPAKTNRYLRETFNVKTEVYKKSHKKSNLEKIETTKEEGDVKIKRTNSNIRHT